jgi:hypothetical protein
MFPATSRYFGIEIVTPDNGYTAAGTMVSGGVVYLRRRFLPLIPPTTVLSEHLITQGDRLDNITARYIGDPEQFWRVCDANNAMQPEELTAELGRRLIIPLPQVQQEG